MKTAAYVTPLILSLKAEPAFASYGSGKGNNGLGNGGTRNRLAIRPSTTAPGTSPGHPGHHNRP